LSAGNSTIGSWLPNGLSITRQSGRFASTSEPIRPRSGMNGTPFSAACRPAWIAGQVESRMAMAREVIAAVKRGAGPNSPRLTAAASTAATQPTPIRRSACRLDVGVAIRVSRRTPRRISAQVAAMATPAPSRGMSTEAPSAIEPSASSRLRATVGMIRLRRAK
jgi:hypothetical protein